MKRRMGGNTHTYTHTDAYTHTHAQGVLNKLTPQKYESNWEALKQLIVEYSDLDINSRMIHFVFEKAIGEQHFSELYAELCKDMSVLSKKMADAKAAADGVPQDEARKRRSPFHKALLMKCQAEFERQKDECEDSMEEYKSRMRGVGAIKFIGELFIRYAHTHTHTHTETHTHTRSAQGPRGRTHHALLHPEAAGSVPDEEAWPGAGGD